MLDMDSNVRDDYLWLLSESAVPLLNQAEEGFRDKVNALTINIRALQRTFFHSQVT